jgi:hypothetical protein
VDLTRITRKYAHIDLTVTLANGTPAAVTGVDVAFLDPQAKPTGATEWTPAEPAGDGYRVLLAGPDADPAGAVVITDAVALWARVTDTPEVDVVKLDRITVR